MNFGTWKVRVNEKDYLEFWHRNPNTEQFEVVKKFKPPLKHKFRKKKQKKVKFSLKKNKKDKKDK